MQFLSLILRIWITYLFINCSTIRFINHDSPAFWHTSSMFSTEFDLDIFHWIPLLCWLIGLWISYLFSSVSSHILFFAVWPIFLSSSTHFYLSYLIVLLCTVQRVTEEYSLYVKFSAVLLLKEWIQNFKSEHFNGWCDVLQSCQLDMNLTRVKKIMLTQSITRPSYPTFSREMPVRVPRVSFVTNSTGK